MSIQLDGFVEKYDNFAPDKGLDVLQNAIEERRRLPIVHCNAIHTKLAKKLHEKYEAIHTNRMNWCVAAKLNIKTLMPTNPYSSLGIVYISGDTM